MPKWLLVRWVAWDRSSSTSDIGGRVADAEARDWAMYPVDQQAGRRGQSLEIQVERGEESAAMDDGWCPKCRQDPERKVTSMAKWRFGGFPSHSA